MKFCIFHDWVKEEFIETKVNSYGLKVEVYRCICKKCGKEKEIEFIV